MSGSDISRTMLQSGLEVTISPKSSRDSNKLITGVIEEILTRSDSHPHGIMVRLTSGEVGRVKGLGSGSCQSIAIEPFSIHDLGIDELVELSESPTIELKSALLWSQDVTEEEMKKGDSPELRKYGRDASKVIAAKVVASFLNTMGGTLLLGVEEDKTTGRNVIVGIDNEFKKLKDKCEDGYRRFLLDGVIQAYFPDFVFNHFSDYLSISFPRYDGKTVCSVSVNPSEKRVFITVKGDSQFIVRVDASCRQLSGEAILDYCDKRFK